MALAAEAGPAPPTIAGTIQQAFVGGFSLAMLTATALLILVAVYVWLRMPKAKQVETAGHTATSEAVR